MKRIVNKKYTVKELRSLMATEGFTLLSDTYENTFTKLNIECPNGHVYTTTRNSWRNGRRCPQCYKENNFGSNTSHWKGGVVERNIPIYSTYHKKLSFCEETRRCPTESRLLQVRCKHCGEWFTPTRYQVENRLYALNRSPSESVVENNFYCSEECKAVCPVYKKCPNASPDVETMYTPHELRVWSNEVRKRANYKCEICGRPATSAHHILPKASSPFYALDPDNGIALCDKCHYDKVHSNECSPALITSLCSKSDDGGS